MIIRWQVTITEGGGGSIMWSDGAGSVLCLAFRDAGEMRRMLSDMIAEVDKVTESVKMIAFVKEFPGMF